MREFAGLWQTWTVPKKGFRPHCRHCEQETGPVADRTTIKSSIVDDRCLEKHNYQQLELKPEKALTTEQRK
ncbi:MAG TPA: hypothetical protein VIB61_03055 [Microbacteriaceae bacterium]